MIIIHILLEYLYLLPSFIITIPLIMPNLNSKRNMKYDYLGKMSYLINLILNGIFTLKSIKNHYTN